MCAVDDCHFSSRNLCKRSSGSTNMGCPSHGHCDKPSRIHRHSHNHNIRNHTESRQTRKTESRRNGGGSGRNAHGGNRGSWHAAIPSGRIAGQGQPFQIVENQDGRSLQTRRRQMLLPYEERTSFPRAQSRRGRHQSHRLLRPRTRPATIPDLGRHPTRSMISSLASWQSSIQRVTDDVTNERTAAFLPLIPTGCYRASRSNQRSNIVRTSTPMPRRDTTATSRAGQQREGSETADIEI